MASGEARRGLADPITLGQVYESFVASHSRPPEASKVRLFTTCCSLPKNEKTKLHKSKVLYRRIFVFYIFSDESVVVVDTSQKPSYVYKSCRKSRAMGLSEQK